MDDQSLSKIEVIIPNLHWRYSGVTATNRMVGPRIARQMTSGWLGRDRPAGVSSISAWDLVRLKFIHRQRQPCVWHARRNNEMIIGWILKKLGWPIALVFTSAAQRRHTALTRFLVRRMDGLIATTEKAAAYLRRPATVIHHGIDTTAFTPPADRAIAFAEAGLPGKYGIGCFGRVRTQKGTDVFVEAMCRLLPRYPDFTAIVMGAATLEHRAFLEKLKKKTAAAGVVDRVIFLGEQPASDVPRWYQRITLFAFTSRDEGFGLTLIEAMAAGNAVVAARAGAAAVVIAGGDTGVLVPPGDVDALVSALEPLMSDPHSAAEMGRRAHAHAHAKHSVDTEANKIVSVYHNILGKAVEHS